MMDSFCVNEQIAKDTFPIFEDNKLWLGLNKNALVPWLIVVPKTDETELFACKNSLKSTIRKTIDDLAQFSFDYFQADKMNVATLGNVVTQLHIHIIARKHDDFAWPEPVWGKGDFLPYDNDKKDAIITAIQKYLN